MVAMVWDRLARLSDIPSQKREKIEPFFFHEFEVCNHIFAPLDNPRMHSDILRKANQFFIYPFVFDSFISFQKRN